jgi:hypothetical protein
MVARGAAPAEIAAVVAAHPEARDAIITFLNQARGNGFARQVVDAGGAKSADAASAKAPAATDAKELTSLVVNVDGQYVQVYVSPGGITLNPDVFMFFHGQRANLGIDPALAPKGNDNASGTDTAAAALAQARAKNTLVMLPQGTRASGGKGDAAGGAMPALHAKGGGLPTFLDDILTAVGGKLAKEGPITPRHIALAGHSAGGYEGVHDALAHAGKYADTITDVTLMDSSYSTSHFLDAQAWLLSGSPGKTVRIIQSTDQLEHNHVTVPDPAHPGKFIDQPENHPHWRPEFSEAALHDAAVAQKMTTKNVVKYDIKGTDPRGDRSRVVQHTQVINDRGEVQGDVLIMVSALEHHEIRDSMMDDAINSIGQGAAGADAFGRNELPGYGRDPSRPHDGNK